MKGKIKKEQVVGLVLAVLAIALVCSMEKWFSQGYVVKCVIKVSSFAFTMAVYTILSKNKFLEVINLHKPEKMWALIGGVALFFCGMAILFFGLQIASPVLLATLGQDIILGLISKTAPQVNVFQLSFLFKPVFGAAIMVWILPMLVNIITDYF